MRTRLCRAFVFASVDKTADLRYFVIPIVPLLLDDRINAATIIASA